MDNNYNENLLSEIKKLKDCTSSIQGFSETFEALETMANKHIEINSSFEENLTHLNEYNKQFSDLNNAIRTNILELKETALKFPEQLNEIADKNKTIIENSTKNIIEKIKELNNETTKTLLHQFEELSTMQSKLRLLLISSIIINFLVLSMIVYKFFFFE